MKTPLTYYGGKQRLASKIIPLIPPHNLYCEPFLGGRAIFFRKDKSSVEVLNDPNGEIVNFYKVVQSHFRKLQKEIRASLHSRDLHRQAMVVYNNPDMFDHIKRAWAVWMLSSQSFSSRFNGSWGYDIKEGFTSKGINRKRNNFTKDYSDRLKEVQFECRDAIYVIKARDRKDSFFYCDPPYFNSSMGHYGGYTKEDFEKLLKTLNKVKGKFLLSSYPSPLLKKYTRKHKWESRKFNQRVSVNGMGKRKSKTEVLTANYPLTNAAA